MSDLWRAKDLVRRANCPLCNAPTEGTVLARRADFLELQRCRVCGLILVDPVPSDDALRRCYEEDYFEGGDPRREIGPDKNYFNLNGNIAVSGYTDIVKRFDLRGKAVLEIGCATGRLLHSLEHMQPARRIGIDVSPAAVAFGKKRFQLDLRCTTLEDAGLAGADFDLIVMIDVIEHVTRPLEFFAEAVRCLQAGGSIFLRTPNADSFEPAGKRWFYLYRGLEHVHYFGHRSLEFLAKEHGLTIGDVWSEGLPGFVPYRYPNLPRITRPLVEPLAVMGNYLSRWRNRHAARLGSGLDLSAVMCKEGKADFSEFE